MKVGERLVEILHHYGSDVVFGVPGGQTLGLYEGILKSDGKVRHILMRDERSAAFAADAYARVSGRTGICDATVGPGATNLVSGLAEAYAASVPVIAIISDLPRGWSFRRRRGSASQGLEQLDIFKAITKWQGVVETPESLDDVVSACFRIANAGRPGPVVLCVPDDVFMSNTLRPFEAGLRPSSGEGPWFRVRPDAELVQRAAAMIAESHYPVIIAGGGVLQSGASDELSTFAVDFGIPVATTLTGKGSISDSSPQAIGVVGSMGLKFANDVVRRADLIIFIGSKTGQVATLAWEYGKSVPVIHIDLDAEEIGRNYRHAFGILADCKLALRDLHSVMDRYEGYSTDWDFIELSKSKNAALSEELSKTGQPMKPQQVIATLQRFITEEDIVVCDASLSSGWGAIYIRQDTPGRRVLTPRGIAGLGWGAPAAIGAAVASQGRVICLAGDGGWAYSLQEVETMRRQNLRITSLVLNNATLAWMKHVERARLGEGNYISTDFAEVNYAMVAQGFGAQGFRASTPEELAFALSRHGSNTGPIVIDVLTDPWETPVLKFSSGAANTDMHGEL